MNLPRTALLALVLGLTGCASGPGIPETTYFRLPPAADIAAGPTRFDAPLVVDAFFADGVHADQSLLYGLDAEGERLRAYHYQMWVDPPTRLLQRRLIRALDQSEVAPLVTARLPPKTRQYRLQMRIEAFERLPRGENAWAVRVALRARLDGSDAGRPLLEKDYRRELEVAGSSVRESVRMLGAAVDQIYAELVADLRALPHG
ncbi:ABC-type transport auxiliary lipoprotein family protein [Pseudomarimonas salicorniae]|uniref:ABC-type transport auxiliary lipoprotein family protein n=1 Tax=Pseudomarimonas salicorniae TaxID=2933270 RepID=A0ABT0GGG4_9GAMM|nr:ABC-type transport auxiliary lipoprotein family protein [Lysobacter sp. CAU 1642]MCK7593633.1 ABC-type transport auxiliary lipoprotein family protein [Lysobacter sp. CAU 1642]